MNTSIPYWIATIIHQWYLRLRCNLWMKRKRKRERAKKHKSNILNYRIRARENKKKKNRETKTTEFASLLLLTESVCTKTPPHILFQLLNTSSSAYTHADFIATNGISCPIIPLQYIHSVCMPYCQELGSESQSDITIIKKYSKRIWAISLEFLYIKYFRP